MKRIAMVLAAAVGGVAPGLQAARVAQAAELFAPPLTLQAASSQPDSQSDYQSPPPDPLGAKPTSPAPSPADELPAPWISFKDQLARNHLYFGGLVLFDVSKVLNGGRDTSTYPLRYLFDAHLLADLDAMGVKGGTAYIDFQSHDESNNRDTAVGDVQGYDNIDASRFVQVYQLWYKQSFGHLHIKIGKIDANTDAAPPGQSATDAFSLMEHGTDFLHNGASYSPSIYFFNTYPDPGPGIQVFYNNPSDWWYAGVGAYYSNLHNTFLVLSGHPQSIERSSGGMFIMGEFGTRWKLWDQPGHMGFEGWWHTGDFPRVEEPAASARYSWGTACFIDQTLWREIQNGKTVRDLGLFFDWGIADDRTDPVEYQLGGGISAKGFLPGRPSDSVGIMASWASFPDIPNTPHNFELATEGFYKIQLTRWASLKPVIQYIAHPSGVERDAVVATLRAEIDF